MSRIVYRKDIDALRGISILLVVIYHAFPKQLPGGFIGVDVFFVISGFLITSIIYGQLKNNNFSFLNFYKRRIRRIFPALFTVLLVSLLIGWLVLFSDEYKQLGYHVASATIFIQNFALIDELGYFNVSSHYKPLLHLWTLSIEEQYYLVWPAVLVFIHRAKINILLFCVFLIVLSFFANIYFVTDYKDIVFFHSLTRFWEIGFGSLLAIYLSDEQRKKQIHNKINSKYAYTIGLLLILFSAYGIKSDSLYPYWIGLLPTIGAVIIIIANLQLRYWWGMVNIGLISYPLYLWHWVVISFMYIYLGKEPSTNLLIIAIAIAFILAYLTNKYIEKIRYAKSNKIIFDLILLALLIGLGGVLVDNHDGVSSLSNLNYIDKFNIEFQRPPATDELCDSIITTTIQDKRMFDYCRASITDNKRKLVAVIGDSHAHVLFSGIAKVAKNYRYDSILLANSSCPPLKSFMWGQNQKEINTCQIKINQILKFLQQETRVEKVVFATRGPVYIHGEVEGKFTKESVDTSLSKIKTPNRQTYEQYFIGFEKTLFHLSNINHIKNIYYYLENPELDFLPKEVIPRPFDYFGISIQDSTVDRSLYGLRMNKYRKLTHEKSSNFSKVTIVDVEPYLCDEEKCHSYKNGNFLYADDDHFSVFGSYYIARKTEDILFLDKN